MFLSRLLRGWQKRGTVARRPRVGGRGFRPTLEWLEDRLVPSLATPVSYNLGTQPDGFIPNAEPQAIVSADFNGDGRLDYPRGVVWGDFNGDGKLDLVVTNIGVGPGGNQYRITGQDEQGTLAVLYGNGDGTFQTPTQYTPSTFPGWTAAGDFNGDGLPDLASTEMRSGHAMDVMLNLPGFTDLPPTFSPVGASSTAITGTSVNLSVLGADDGGEANLTYAWSAWTTSNGVDAPAAVTFSASGTNAARNTTATFTAAKFSTTPNAPHTDSGGYDLRVTITDAAGLQTVGMIHVNVYQTLSRIVVTPGSAALSDCGTQQFTAAAYDQFGKPLATQPTFTWSASGGGSVSGGGLYTGPAAGSGTATVAASSGGVIGRATVSYTGTTAPPFVSGITPAVGPVTGGTTVVLTGSNFTGVNAVRVSRFRPQWQRQPDGPRHAPAGQRHRQRGPAAQPDHQQALGDAVPPDRP